MPPDSQPSWIPWEDVKLVATEAGRSVADLRMGPGRFDWGSREYLFERRRVFLAPQQPQLDGQASSSTATSSSLTAKSSSMACASTPGEPDGSSKAKPAARRREQEVGQQDGHTETRGTWTWRKQGPVKDSSTQTDPVIIAVSTDMPFQ